MREFRTNLAELLDEVADRREHVTVTRHGRPAAVLVPIDEYLALVETAELLSDDDALAAIRNVWTISPRTPPRAAVLPGRDVPGHLPAPRRTTVRVVAIRHRSQANGTDPR